MTAPSVTHRLPPTAYELMCRQVPSLQITVEKVAAELRQRPGWTDATLLAPWELIDIDKAQDFLSAYGRALVDNGTPPDVVRAHAELLGNHLQCFINFELLRRKVFWVEESLAFMLAQTALDIEGSALKLPFPSFAIVYTDRETLELAEACLARDGTCFIGGRTLRSLTVHVNELEDPHAPDAEGISAHFFFDAGQDDWPYILGRDLCIRPDDHLDAILESHFPDVIAGELGPIYHSPELKRLLHLAVNTILFITSPHEPWRILTSAAKTATEKARGWGKGKKQRAAKLRNTCSTEDVFELPGKIPIARLLQLRELRRKDEGRIFSRFMVRGHWRRALSTWKDQHVRWIEPYWKGADLPTIIERNYRLKP